MMFQKMVRSYMAPCYRFSSPPRNLAYIKYSFQVVWAFLKPNN